VTVLYLYAGESQVYADEPVSEWVRKSTTTTSCDATGSQPHDVIIQSIIITKHNAFWDGNL